MHYAHKYIARFGIFLFQPAAQSVGQRFVAGFVALDDFAGRFVYHHNVVVFVEYFHR